MSIFSKISKKNKADIYPALQDSYAYILSQLSNYSPKIMFISNDDDRLEQLAKQLEFFAPGKKVIILPDWDCMPYDRISPNINNLAQRINALSELSSLKEENVILLTSLPAFVQRLPPKSYDVSRDIKIGDVIDREEFIKFLLQLSFRRVEVASEPGDFAIRGDIIDIVSSDDDGWRLDFFGKKLEKIRLFDPATQISDGFIDKIHLLPSSEVVLNSESILNFCQNFQKNFGTDSTDHPLYEAIEGGRKYPGMEHYLPLFYDHLSDVFDYFSPSNIICDHHFHENLDRYLNSINDHYEARKELLVNRFPDEVIYYPLPPKSLWMDHEEIDAKIIKFNFINLHNFSIDTADGIDLDIKKTDDFNLASQNKQISAFDLFKKYREEHKKRVIVTCNSEGSLQRIQNMLENYNIHSYRLNSFDDYKNISGKTVGITMLSIDRGFSTSEFAIVTEQDLLGERIVRKKTAKSMENLMQEINNLQIGEYVVHQEHGIGLFDGLETIEVMDIEHDCIKLLYEGNDVLYIPVENLDLLTRYGGSEDHIRLDKLGGVSWKHRKAKLKDKLKEIAAELIKTAALRSSKEAEVLQPISEAYQEFCMRFPYVETDDQMNSISDVLEDLSSGKPMDRLVCGDVGFGKTEIAMRAAFIATHPDQNIKKQVAIIVPTTLLCRQHYHSFFKRFSGFPVKVKQLSRLVNSKEIKKTKEGLKDGSVDIIIGTHALLAKDVEFKNLGLLIVDEEQRFGVIQKEKLKKIQNNTHILTLSATPIPRTLQMSLTGVRDLSIIATPPVDRQVVKTYIMPYDSVVIREAILREFYRGGQVFFVCPRISDIKDILPKLTELVPEIKIVVAHGKMTPKALEEIMTDFYNKKFHLLLSTSIVESGIDIAEANTMIIHRADKFGLSALYQLRGRVGRSNVKAFSYLLLPNKKLKKLAMTRLDVMQTLDTLGAGFTVASHDMDIRGFGNLVGDEQSGHIKEVGLELYQQMLQEAIFAIKNPDSKNEIEEDYSPQINLGLPVLLPDDYIADLNLRLSLYRNLAALKTSDEVEQFAVELVDRFGKYPIEVEYLLAVIKLKIKAKKINVDKIDSGPKAITFAFRDHKCLHPEKMMDFVSKNQMLLKIRPDHKLLISKSFTDVGLKIKFIGELLDKLNFRD